MSLVGTHSPNHAFHTSLTPPICCKMWRRILRKSGSVVYKEYHICRSFSILFPCADISQHDSQSSESGCLLENSLRISWDGFDYVDYANESVSAYWPPDPPPIGASIQYLSEAGDLLTEKEDIQGAQDH